MKDYMAIDQYGYTYHGLEHPRKDLMHILDRKHADKMYIDDGIHIGYIIAGLWLTVYQVNRMDKS
jgi:hypothetical protein